MYNFVKTGKWKENLVNSERLEVNLSFESKFWSVGAVWEKWEGFFSKKCIFSEFFLVIFKNFKDVKMIVE